MAGAGRLGFLLPSWFPLYYQGAKTADWQSIQWRQNIHTQVRPFQMKLGCGGWNVGLASYGSMPETPFSAKSKFQVLAGPHSLQSFQGRVLPASLGLWLHSSETLSSYGLSPACLWRFFCLLQGH